MRLFAALVCLFAATTAHAQLSGDLDGKWTHHVIHLAGGGLTVPVADVWTVATPEGPVMMWTARHAIDRADLGRPMVVVAGADAAPSTGAAVTVQRAKTLGDDATLWGAHLYVRDEDGVADTLIGLELPAGCRVGCAIEGLTVTHLPGATLTLARASAPRSLHAVDAFPLAPGDVQLGKL